MTGRFAEGDRVDGLYDGNSDDVWYPGHVHAYHPDDATFDILYDDGESERHVPPQYLRRHVEGTLCVGTRVFARYAGGDEWYPGKIQEVCEDGAFTIEYDDGEVEAGVTLALIRETIEIAGDEPEEGLAAEEPEAAQVVDETREEEVVPAESVTEPAQAEARESHDEMVHSTNSEPVEIAQEAPDEKVEAVVQQESEPPIHDVVPTPPSIQTPSEEPPSETAPTERRKSRPNEPPPPLVAVPPAEAAAAVDASDEYSSILSTMEQLEASFADAASAKALLSTLVKQMRAFPQATAELVHVRGGESLLVELLARHHAHAVIQCYGFVLLRRLCFLCGKSSHLLLRHGIVDLVAMAMRKFSDDAILQAAACGALAVFTRVHAGLTALLDHRVSHLVLATIIFHKSYSVHTRQVHYYACEVLLELCELGDKTTIDALCGDVNVASGGPALSELSPVSLLLFLLRQALSFDDKKACCAVGTLLMCLASCHRPAAQVILDLQGLTELSTVMAKYPMEPGIQKYAASASREIAACAVDDGATILPGRQQQHSHGKAAKRKAPVSGLNGFPSPSHQQQVAGANSRNDALSFARFSSPIGKAPHLPTSFPSPSYHPPLVSSPLVILDGHGGRDKKLHVKEERQHLLFETYGVDAKAASEQRTQGIKRRQLKTHIVSAADGKLWASPVKATILKEGEKPLSSRVDKPRQAPRKIQSSGGGGGGGEKAVVVFAGEEGDDGEERSPATLRKQEQRPPGRGNRSVEAAKTPRSTTFHLKLDQSSGGGGGGGGGETLRSPTSGRKTKSKPVAKPPPPSQSKIKADGSTESLNSYATQLFREEMAAPVESLSAHERERLSFAEKLHKMIDKAKMSLAQGSTASLELAAEPATIKHAKRKEPTATKSKVAAKTAAVKPVVAVVVEPEPPKKAVKKVTGVSASLYTTPKVAKPEPPVLRPTAPKTVAKPKPASATKQAAKPASAAGKKEAAVPPPPAAVEHKTEEVATSQSTDTQEEKRPVAEEAKTVAAAAEEVRPEEAVVAAVEPAPTETPPVEAPTTIDPAVAVEAETPAVEATETAEEEAIVSAAVAVVASAADELYADEYNDFDDGENNAPPTMDDEAPSAMDRDVSFEALMTLTARVQQQDTDEGDALFTVAPPMETEVVEQHSPPSDEERGSSEMVTPEAETEATALSVEEESETAVAATTETVEEPASDEAAVVIEAVAEPVEAATASEPVVEEQHTETESMEEAETPEESMATASTEEEATETEATEETASVPSVEKPTATESTEEATVGETTEETPTAAESVERPATEHATMTVDSDASADESSEPAPVDEQPLDRPESRQTEASYADEDFEETMDEPAAEAEAEKEDEVAEDSPAFVFEPEVHADEQPPPSEATDSATETAPPSDEEKQSEAGASIEQPADTPTPGDDEDGGGAVESVPVTIEAEEPATTSEPVVVEEAAPLAHDGSSSVEDLTATVDIASPPESEDTGDNSEPPAVEQTETAVATADSGESTIVPSDEPSISEDQYAVASELEPPARVTTPDAYGDAEFDDEPLESRPSTATEPESPVIEAASVESPASEAEEAPAQPAEETIPSTAAADTSRAGTPDVYAVDAQEFEAEEPTKQVVEADAVEAEQESESPSSQPEEKQEEAVTAEAEAALVEVEAPPALDAVDDDGPAPVDAQPIVEATGEKTPDEDPAQVEQPTVEAATSETTVEEASTEPATVDEVATEPATVDEAATEPATVDEAATEPATEEDTATSAEEAAPSAYDVDTQQRVATPDVYGDAAFDDEDAASSVVDAFIAVPVEEASPPVQSESLPVSGDDTGPVEAGDNAQAPAVVEQLLPEERETEGDTTVEAERVATPDVYGDAAFDDDEEQQTLDASIARPAEAAEEEGRASPLDEQQAVDASIALPAEAAAEEVEGTSPGDEQQTSLEPASAVDDTAPVDAKHEELQPVEREEVAALQQDDVAEVETEPAIPAISAEEEHPVAEAVDVEPPVEPASEAVPVDEDDRQSVPDTEAGLAEPAAEEAAEEERARAEPAVSDATQPEASEGEQDSTEEQADTTTTTAAVADEVEAVAVDGEEDEPGSDPQEEEVAATSEAASIAAAVDAEESVSESPAPVSEPVAELKSAAVQDSDQPDTSSEPTESLAPSEAPAPTAATENEPLTEPADVAASVETPTQARETEESPLPATDSEPVPTVESETTNDDGYGDEFDEPVAEADEEQATAPVEAVAVASHEPTEAVAVSTLEERASASETLAVDEEAGSSSEQAAVSEAEQPPTEQAIDKSAVVKEEAVEQAIEASAYSEESAERAPERSSDEPSEAATAEPVQSEGLKDEATEPTTTSEAVVAVVSESDETPAIHEDVASASQASEQQPATTEDPSDEYAYDDEQEEAAPSLPAPSQEVAPPTEPAKDSSDEDLYSDVEQALDLETPRTTSDSDPTSAKTDATPADSPGEYDDFEPEDDAAATVQAPVPAQPEPADADEYDDFEDESSTAVVTAVAVPATAAKDTEEADDYEVEDGFEEDEPKSVRIEQPATAPLATPTTPTAEEDYYDEFDE